MKLSRIAQIVGGSLSGSDVAVNDLQYDSTQVRQGSLFICIPGGKVDGHSFAQAAAASGASALLCERPLRVGLPEVRVTGARTAMNSLAAPFFGFPSSEMKVLGITGTNGKTTSAYIAESIFRAAGMRTGLTGTVETRIAGESFPVGRTTPESVDLQRLFRLMVTSGVTHAAVEVSSEGLDAGRVEGSKFVVAMFTNLSRDHLDHHKNMESYYLAKRALFDTTYANAAVVNIDDFWGKRLADETGLEVFSVGSNPSAMFRIDDIAWEREGSAFSISGRGLEISLRTVLPGRFNVANAAGAAVAAHLVGIPPGAIQEGIASLAGVPGRFEPVDEGQDFLVVVDYAHTPDGLENVLVSAGEMASGRVICVFGCGGDRDATKRPLMGEIAAKRSGIAIATSDNPRSEDPLVILEAVKEGLESVPGAVYSVIPDRREAIEAAMKEAAPGDVVVIAGKGHETGQEINGRITPFDDRLVATEALRSLK